MPPEIKTPAKVCRDQGEGEAVITQQDEFSERRAKRKNGNAWSEERGRYLWLYGPNGSTVFDTWVWFGEPLRRGHP